MSTDLPQLVVQELRSFIGPLARIAEADDQLLAAQRFVRSCGWSTTEVVDPAPIVALVSGLEEAFAAIENDLVPDSLQEALARVDVIAGLIDSVKSIGESIGSLSIPGPVASDALLSFSADVASRLLIAWLAEKTPLLDVATVLGFVEYIDVPASSGGSLTRGPGRRPQFRADLLSAFLSAPVDSLTHLFAPDGWDEPEGAVFTNLMLQSALGPLARSLGGRWMVHPDVLRRGDEIAELGRQAVVAVPVPAAVDGQVASFDVELEFVSRADHTASGSSGPAVHVVPYGTFSSHSEIDDWSIDSAASLLIGGAEPTELPALTIGTNGVETVPELTARLEVAARHLLDLVVGSGRTGLTLGEIRLGVFGTIEDGAADAGFSVVAADSSVGISTADFGSVVSSILSFDASVGFDLGLEWSLNSGLRLTGSASLELLLSSGFDLGVVSLGDIMLSFELGELFEIIIITDVAISIGPIDMSFHGVGLAFILNLSELHLEIEPVSPTLLVIAITSEAVNGGGFLEIDSEAGRYAGGLALDMFGFGISAIVIVDTELPGNPDAWALFASLGATFPSPIPLGFGFTLLGVGGILALDRTMDAEALAAGLRNGVIDSMLFPEDPLGDSAQLLAQIDDYFPFMEGNTVVGPVVMLGWGTPTIITAQLGVVVSLPDGVIAVMGSVAALLPVPDAPLLTLNMDSLGVVDVSAGTFSLSASLYDSRLLTTIDLGGDMAMYLRTSDQPYFLLSVGGYHPSFHPPSTVPPSMHDLRRMSASIAIADVVTVTIQAYFAVTSNSLQFGASVNLEASVEIWPTTYTARGWFEFDVLLIFSPFKIVAGMSAGVGIYAGNKELMGVDLAAHLEGPEPWYASGRAAFKFFGLKVEFEVEVGGKAVGEPKPIAHPRVEVLAALGLPVSWQEAGRVDGLGAGITYLTPSEDSGDTVWVRPDHQLTVRQSIAPLDRTLEIIGQAVPAAGEELLHITAAGIGHQPADCTTTTDWFAPAQFEDLDRTEKLARVSFEEMNAGVTFGHPGAGITVRPDDLTTCVDTGYEEAEWTVEEDSLADSKHSGAAGIALAKYTAAAAPAFVIASTEYTLVSALDGRETTLALTDTAHARGGVSQFDALHARSVQISGDPGARTRLVVVPVSAVMVPIPIRELDFEPVPGQVPVP